MWSPSTDSSGSFEPVANMPTDSQKRRSSTSKATRNQIKKFTELVKKPKEAPWKKFSLRKRRQGARPRVDGEDVFDDVDTAFHIGSEVSYSSLIDLYGGLDDEKFFGSSFETVRPFAPSPLHDGHISHRWDKSPQSNADQDTIYPESSVTQRISDESKYRPARFITPRPGSYAEFLSSPHHTLWFEEDFNVSSADETSSVSAEEESRAKLNEAFRILAREHRSKGAAYVVRKHGQDALDSMFEWARQRREEQKLIQEKIKERENERSLEVKSRVESWMSKSVAGKCIGYEDEWSSSGSESETSGAEGPDSWRENKEYRDRKWKNEMDSTLRDIQARRPAASEREQLKNDAELLGQKCIDGEKPDHEGKYQLMLGTERTDDVEDDEKQESSSLSLSNNEEGSPMMEELMNGIEEMMIDSVNTGNEDNLSTELDDVG